MTTKRLLLSLCAALLLLLAHTPAHADGYTDKMALLHTGQTVELNDWKFHLPAVPGGEQPDFDDSSWDTAHVKQEWGSPNTQAWFRYKLVVPSDIDGQSTEGRSLRFFVGMDDAGYVYVNGKDLGYFNWDDGTYVLSRSVHPGETLEIAIKAINNAGTGQLHFARLVYGLPAGWQPQFTWLQQELEFFSQLAPQLSAASQQRVQTAVQEAEASCDLTKLNFNSPADAPALLEAARQKLLPLADIVADHQVYYVGHAHIDMNWLWPWPETIDVCHRTWDSAMLLMNQFPDFDFVQSQPGAYLAIQKRYPSEFAAMQAASKRGQWDTVSGFWDESDTDMPSGEGLAMSLFLGQRYFLKYFGHYAVTGWLPDSFGHSWQLPQLMNLVGIHNFYHMRCGDGIRLAWWQSPDGSRVLKANTDNYDEPVDLSQLLRPWHNQQKLGVKKALVVFGVGDHGGGPTRQQIRNAIRLQKDPLLPKVHFDTADNFFRTLRADPASKQLPVVDTDLQYVFEGCYTTHADLKKALRTGENTLYTAQTLASLGAMEGRPYPVMGFETAWQPVVFAQFHDIMCGSAIHSTYTWMLNRLAPAQTYAEQQTASALQTLCAHLDTRGGRPGEQAVAVWNPLSFTRTAVVKVTLPDAARFHSVRDSTGLSAPVQAMGSHTLLFLAQNMPGFGSAVYFLSPRSVSSAYAPLAVKKGSDFLLQNGLVQVKVSGSTGLFLSLKDLKTGREMLQNGKSGNLLERLGDKGNAWDIDFTGKETDLVDQDARVQLIADGPLCAVLLVQHKLAPSTYTQYITIYRGMGEVDVKNDTDWHDHAQMLKVAFPFAMTNPALRVGIPYGSISRPDNGQENPGQKWMDMTDYSGGAVHSALPIDLSSSFNNTSSKPNMDGSGHSFDLALFPPAGITKAGTDSIPVRLHGNLPGPDNVVGMGQTVKLPVLKGANRLYLVGMGVNGTQGGLLKLHLANGKSQDREVSLGDWIVGGYSASSTAFTFAHWIDHGQAGTNNPHLWIISLDLPEESRTVSVTLPNNTQMHIFGMTLTTATPGSPLYGVTILNDSKYGCDARGATFRLSLLRSSNSPDPDPDEGEQVYSYALLPHSGGWRSAEAEQAGLAFNIPLDALAVGPHKGEPSPLFRLSAGGKHDIEAGALKHSEDGKGYILRLFETQGRNTRAYLRFEQNVEVQETDILEHPLSAKVWRGKEISLPVGHDKIVTLHIMGLPDAGR